MTHDFFNDDGPQLAVPQHEAGHTVVALALGIGVVSVSVDDRRTVCDPAFILAMPKNALPVALFYLGGMIYEQIDAQLYMLDRRPLPLERDLRDRDVTQAYNFADMLNDGHARPETMSRLMSMVIEILYANLPAAKAVSLELQQRRRLTGLQVEELWSRQGGQRAVLEPVVDLA